MAAEGAMEVYKVCEELVKGQGSIFESAAADVYVLIFQLSNQCYFS